MTTTIDHFVIISFSAQWRLQISKIYSKSDKSRIQLKSSYLELLWLFWHVTTSNNKLQLNNILDKQTSQPIGEPMKLASGATLKCQYLAVHMLAIIGSHLLVPHNLRHGHFQLFSCQLIKRKFCMFSSILPIRKCFCCACHNWCSWLTYMYLDQSNGGASFT